MPLRHKTPARTAAIVAALLGTGCLGRSLAEESARVLVRWVIEPSLACDEQFPLMRVRSAVPVTVGGEPDDEEFDWLPCVDLTGTRQGLTAPLPVGTYAVTVTMHDGRDGAALAQSDTATVTIVAEAQEIEQITVNFTRVTTRQGEARAPAPEAPAAR